MIGVFWTVQAFAERGMNPLWWISLITGILMIVLGFWTAGQFFIEKAYVLLVFAGIWALFQGVTDLVRAFQIRAFDEGARVGCIALIALALVPGRVRGWRRRQGGGPVASRTHRPPRKRRSRARRHRWLSGSWPPSAVSTTRSTHGGSTAIRRRARRPRTSRSTRSTSSASTSC